MSLISIGSDMEVFGVTKEGFHKALCGKIGGTKEQPLQLPNLVKGYMVQEDNVALEFNVPYVTDKKSWIVNFMIMRDQVQQILSREGLLLSPEASVSFDKFELQHPNALVFGCEPDYDAWSMKENQKPQAKDENLRTAGGHIHVGTDVDMVQGVRNMDLFLGVPSVLIDDKPSSNARRELYGKAGAMRPKPYGFEYRVLSNFWMFTDSLVGWVYDNTKRACVYTIDLTEKEGKIIQECINTGNKELANSLVAKYDILLPA